ncbi:MAG: putative fluoride ion transporter CrcB 1 [Cyanobacteriota bacterium]|jgi:CrcB protein
MLRDILLVSVGAVPGAWLRFRLVNHFEPMIPAKHWATFGVNLVASFALGLLVALNQRCAASQLLLLLATGFLGSLSTFSTFIVEVLLLLRKRAPGEALLLALVSVVTGLFAVELGLWLGGMPWA